MRHPLEEPWEYEDEGCELHPACLRCPLPRCLQEEPGGSKRREKRQRDREVLRLRCEEGKSIAELARKFGLSRRTIYRILRRGEKPHTLAPSPASVSGE